MTSKHCKCGIFLLGILTGLVFRAAAADWPSITPEEKAMTSVPQQLGAPAVILYREEITDDTKNFRTIYVRLKVLTEAGIKFGNVEIPVGRNPITISQVTGRTVHADGQIIPWEDQPVDKVVLRDHGVRTHVKAFSLPSVQVGSILDYRYSLHFPEESRNAPVWLVQSDLFQKKVLFKFIPTKYQPKTDALRGNSAEFIGNNSLEQTSSEYTWISHLPEGKEPEEHNAPQDTYKWVGLEMRDVPSSTHEPDMPPEGAVSWRVEMLYRITAKPDVYWKGAGKAWNKRVEAFLERKNGIGQAVDQLITTRDAAETKIRKIYAFVSQLENQSFASVSGPAPVPTPSTGAEEVLQKRSGTHDELNRLFVAMVRAAGIPATMMLLPDRGRAAFEMNFASTDQLDGEVAIVQLGGQDVFLDPGTKFCPYGVLNWHYAGTRGLRQNANGSQTLAATPPPTYKDALIQRMAQLQITEKGTMAGMLGVGFSGMDAMVRRQQAAGMSAEGRKKLLEDEVGSWLPSGTQVTLTNVPEWDNTEGTLFGKFKVAGPLVTISGEQWVLPVHVFQVNEKPRFTSAQRAQPVYFDYASRQVDEVHFLLPARVELENLPVRKEAKTLYALYSSEQKREGDNGVMSTRDMAMNGVLFAPDGYKELKDFYDKVAAGDSEPAALKGPL